MSQDKKRERESEKAKRRFGGRRFFLAALIVVVVCSFIVWRAVFIDSRSIDERLAAIDTELAIPDTENAAVFYGRFFNDPNNLAIIDHLFGDTQSAYCEAWSDAEYPELAAKLKKHEVIIQTFLDISQMKNARLPVNPEPGTDWGGTASYFLRGTFILSWAAANDLAEGRVDAAFSKYQRQMRLARELEHSISEYNLLSLAIEAIASWNVRTAVMRQETTPEQLKFLEQVLGISFRRIEGRGELDVKLVKLNVQKKLFQLPLVEKLKCWRINRKIQKERAEQKRRRRLRHLRLESTRKATRILIALRLHKEKTGAWPETLEEIEPRLPSQMLIDPQNDGLFVYKRDGDGFLFYSKGPNGIDEIGTALSNADDYAFWPPGPWLTGKR